MSTTTGDEQSNIIRVHLSNGSSNNVRYNDRTTVSRIMEVMVAQLAGSDGDVSHFGIRLVHEPRQLPTETYWLHRACTMKTILGQFPVQKEWRYELRIRFLPSNLREFHRTQRRCFEFFYDQVRNDYLAHVAPKIEEQTSLELGCLEIRRLFKDMQSSALDKKANMEFIENDIGLDRFFPAILIQQNKTKMLRRKIQSTFKRFAPLSESDCMFKFLETLAKIARYDIEIFKASLGTQWSNPVEIVVGPEIGLCYVTGSSNGPTKLADFMHVTEIETSIQQPQQQQTTTTRHNNKAAVVSFRLSGATDVLHITCPNAAIADSLAHLVEGYYMLLTQAMYSVWVQREDALLLSGGGSQCNGGINMQQPPAGSNRHKSPARDRKEPPVHQQSSASTKSTNPPSTASAVKQPTTNSNTTDVSAAQQQQQPYSQASTTAAPIATAELIDEDDFDYATPLNRNYQVDRTNVMLEELLGEGQFGDVYKGSLLLKTEETIPVAIKTCKVESEEVIADSFLEEAYIMQQFDHPHIVRLLGVCLDSPIWLLIELAPLGEQREAKKLKEFLEDYDDERDDPKYYRKNAFIQRKRDFDREREADLRDRQQEKEELEEMRRAILQEGFSGNSEAEALRRIEAQETKLLRKLRAVSDSPPHRRLGEAADESSSDDDDAAAESDGQQPSTAAAAAGDDEQPTNDKAEPEPVSVDSPLPQSTSSPAAAVADRLVVAAGAFNHVYHAPEYDQRSSSTNNNNNNNSGWHTVDAPAQPAAGVQAPTVALPQRNAQVRQALQGVFGDDIDEDNKDKPAAAVTADDKKQRVKVLIESIPTAKDALFEYNIDWTQVDELLVERRVKPWINKKINEYIGEDEPSLVQFIGERIVAHAKPNELLRDIAMVLDDEAEVFVVKMWRLLIYESEAKKLGLVKCD